MVYVVNGILASGVDMLLEKDLVGFALQKMEIHPLIMIFQHFHPPSTTSYSIDHQEHLNQQRISDVHIRWDKIEESLLNMMQSFCEVVIQQKQTANIDQSPPQEMSIQEIEDLKQQYLDEMLSLSNQIQIKDYENEKIDIWYRRECEFMIDELKGKFNGMTFATFQLFNDDDDYEESTIPLNEIDENLSTIPEKESDEFIKSSVEGLVPIPSESKDTSESDSECDLPSCNDFSPINVFKEKYVTFSNPLFDSNDDFTSSDDESLSDEDVSKDNVKIYSNLLFEFDDEYISSDVNPLFDEVLENNESKDSYVSNLDEPALLVTPLFDANEDECFDPGGKIDEIDAFLDIDVSTGIENGYHDSEGDIIYLESLVINDTIPNLPPEVFLDHDPRNLKDETDKDDLKSSVKVFDPGIHEKTFSPTYDCLDFEDSRARGFVHHSLDLQSFACFYIWESDILDLID
ncbi:hypothetical protein Tco_0653485 [Tanacetum coccineum]|uniref:Uncharacterized protein n=1 Tax=Tanacetum coccineum TaxID=301880 RepID=A0ABQ4X0I6_9ASTR